MESIAKQPKVLILEDYISVRHLIYVELKHRNIESVEAENFADAFLKFQSTDGKFDWIITEYELNHDNTGIKFINWVEKINPTIRSIILTNNIKAVDGYQTVKGLKAIISKHDEDFFGQIERTIKGE